MKTTSEISIVLVCTDCTNTRILYHGVKEEIAFSHIITESPVTKKTLIKRRIKKQGWWTTFGQLIFQAGIVPLMRRLSAGKVNQILTTKRLSTLPLPGDKIIHVASVNGEEFTNAIHAINPDLIIVNGTRIISEKTLSKINCPIINVHVGITPLYRGVHGAYWALANNDREHCGVTIHAIDKGIDTGSIIAQDIIEPGKDDNFITYPYLQFEKAILLIRRVVPQIINNSYSFQKAPAGHSRLWYHPTVWQYLYNRFKGVK